MAEKENMNSIISSRVSSIRRAKHLTIEDLADKLQWSKSKIYRYEQPTSKIGAWYDLSEIADALEVPLAALVSTGEDASTIGDETIKSIVCVKQDIRGCFAMASNRTVLMQVEAMLKLQIAEEFDRRLDQIEEVPEDDEAWVRPKKRPSKPARKNV